MQNHAETLAVLRRDGRFRNTALSVTDELCRCAMDTDPPVLNGRHQRLGFLICDLPTSMPSSASVDHVENHVFSNEQDIKLDLFVESVGDAYADLVVRSRPHPLATRGTRIDDFLDYV